MPGKQWMVDEMARLTLLAGRTVLLCCPTLEVAEAMRKRIDPKGEYSNQISVMAMDEETSGLSGTPPPLLIIDGELL